LGKIGPAFFTREFLIVSACEEQSWVDVSHSIDSPKFTTDSNAIVLPNGDGLEPFRERSSLGLQAVVILVHISLTERRGIGKNLCTWTDNEIEEIGRYVAVGIAPNLITSYKVRIERVDI